VGLDRQTDELGVVAAGQLDRGFQWVPEHAAYTTLLMSTGLTFGTISATYGYNAGIIDRTQFSVLVAVVVLSAVVPTAIAQRLFTPQVAPSPEPARGPERA
jgi:Kef-type K+ transport system membrane component KefB